MLTKVFAALVMLIVAACAPAQAPTPPLASTATPIALTATPMPTALSSDSSTPVAENAVIASDRPDWHHLALTNARTGESFTIADLVGKTVYVEPMATWCTNCRQQQRIVVDVHNQLDTANYVFISLSVGENIGDADLAAYAEREGFPWTFSVASPELLTALVNAFGRTVANPPSTPHFIIGPDGAVSALATGQHSANALLAELTQFGEA